MEARVVLSGSEDVQEELISLRRWLSDEPEFRGRVRIQEAPVQFGQMGGLVEALSVAVASGGALTVLANSVSVWLRERRSTLTVKIVKPDGTVEDINASGRAADTIAAKVDPQQLG
jgi:hypothetical protein